MYNNRPQSSGGSSNSSFRRSPRPGSGSGSRFGSRTGGAPASRGGFSSGPRRTFNRRPQRSFSQNINPSRFVNKAIITEQVEHFVPQYQFSDFAVDQSLKNNLIQKGYKEPTPIQDKSIPHILRGLDVVGIANTGTGKTAAFLIPLIDKVIKNPKEQVLIVVPTRELAIQIVDELKAFTKGMKIHSVTCIGGANIGPQIRELRFHNNFIIGTPGRLKDLIQNKYLNLNNFRSLVLDEADRMLDMGFINDIKFLVGQMPASRHTLFFSATMSPEIESLIKTFLREPVKISVKTQDTSANVDQDIVRVNRGEDKILLLADLLRKEDFKKVLVFCRTKYGAEKLSRSISIHGITAESIHGDKSHSHRQKALKRFKEDAVQVLVATDVAARGLDISGITHVINYDVPATYDDYVHRIGRTGRGAMKGKALTFVE